VLIANIGALLILLC